MRFYIVDNAGNVCGEAPTYSEAELILSCHSEEEIKEKELKIISDTEGE